MILEYSKAPTLDQMTHRLSGAKVFSKLDAKDDFQSIHLDNKSSCLTTFNTHKGCCWFLRMPYGLKMSPNVFQIWMDHITSRLPRNIAMHNDICVYGRHTAEYDRNLLQLMQRAAQQGLVFNSSKCAIVSPKFPFMVLSLQHKARDHILQRDKLCKTFQLLKIHRNSCCV